MNEYVRLFANIIPIKGYVRSALYDLGDQTLALVPNFLVDSLERLKTESVKEVVDSYSTEDQETLREYLQYLEQKPFVFYCGEKDLQCFPDLDLDWDSPFEIENCIIDIDEKTDHFTDSLFEHLNELKVPAVQIRIFNPNRQAQLMLILDRFRNSPHKNIDIVLPYLEMYSDDYIKELIDANPKIKSLVFHGSSFARRDSYKGITIFYVQYDIISEKQCGIINRKSLVVDMKVFTEGQCYNTCLNRKLSIDKNGNIMNCPSLEKSFGRDYSMIPEIINSEEFRKHWQIHKQDVEICRICEYRYACTDCRAYLSEGFEKYAQPRKCTYNPFIAKWKDENGYVPVNACGYYNEHGKFTEDKEKIRQINSQLWG